MALLRLGFAVPPVLPPVRWALTPPFHPYQQQYLIAGGLFSVALSIVDFSDHVQELPGNLPRGARTFLECSAFPRYIRDRPASTYLTPEI